VQSSAVLALLLTPPLAPAPDERRTGNHLHSNDGRMILENAVVLLRHQAPGFNIGTGQIAATANLLLFEKIMLCRLPTNPRKS
jgi:hypothetical protein